MIQMNLVISINLIKISPELLYFCMSELASLKKTFTTSTKSVSINNTAGRYHRHMGMWLGLQCIVL